MNWNIIDNRVSPTTSRVDCESLLDRTTEGSDPAWWEPKTRPAQNTTRYVSSEEEPTIDWVSSGLLSTGRLYFGPPDNNDYDQTTQRLCTHPSLVPTRRAGYWYWWWWFIAVTHSLSPTIAREERETEIGIDNSIIIISIVEPVALKAYSHSSSSSISPK